MLLTHTGEFVMTFLERPAGIKPCLFSLGGAGVLYPDAKCMTKRRSSLGLVRSRQAAAELLLVVGLFTAQANNLFVSDWATHSIFKYTPDGVRTTFASGLSSPEGLAFDQAGNLYVGNAGSEVVRITPAGETSVFAIGLINPYGLAFNHAGDLFVSTDSGTVFRITPDGAKSTFASGFAFPFGIAFDSAGNLFVADAGHYQIVKVTPAGQSSVFAYGIYNYPEGMAFNSSGDLFISQNGGGVLRFTPDGNSSGVASGSSTWLGMAFDQSGVLFVADFTGNGIFKIAPDGVKSAFVSDVRPFGMAFEGIGLPVPEPSLSNLLLVGFTAGFLGTNPLRRR
jgi:streptogramin lyase